MNKGEGGIFVVEMGEWNMREMPSPLGLPGSCAQPHVGKAAFCDDVLSGESDADLNLGCEVSGNDRSDPHLE